MPNTPHPDMLLVEQIRSGKPEAWNTLIAQSLVAFGGYLLLGGVKLLKSGERAVIE